MHGDLNFPHVRTHLARGPVRIVRVWPKSSLKGVLSPSWDGKCRENVMVRSLVRLIPYGDRSWSVLRVQIFVHCRKLFITIRSIGIRFLDLSRGCIVRDSATNDHQIYSRSNYQAVFVDNYYQIWMKLRRKLNRLD